MGMKKEGERDRLEGGSTLVGPPHLRKKILEHLEVLKPAGTTDRKQGPNWSQGMFRKLRRLNWPPYGGAAPEPELMALTL